MINNAFEVPRGDHRVVPLSHQAFAYREGLALTATIRLSRLPVALLMTMIATAAHAQSTGITGVTGGAAAATMLNNISTFILGPFGQSLAVLAIIGIGLAWMFGRVSLGLIAGVVGGIIIMFGASYLASTLTTAG